MAAVVLSLIVSGCASADRVPRGEVAASTTSPATTTSETSETTLAGLSQVTPAAADYLNQVLEIARENYWNAQAVDWEMELSRLFSYSDGAQKPADAYVAIRAILQEIDRHGTFLTPEEVDAFLADGEGHTAVTVDEPSPGVGRVQIPAYSGAAGPIANEWAGNAQVAIYELAPEVCGWLVDLRSNTGGNMWPMLAALGPLLGDVQVGSFTSPDGTSIPWRYESGAAYEGEDPIVRIEKPVPDLGPTPIAVLIGPNVGSSGEATLVALLGRPSTRTFGQATAGVPTANYMFELSDGALLFWPSALFTDRSGHTYPGNTPIEPNQMTNVEDTMDAAVEWLLDQPGCAQG